MVPGYTRTDLLKAQMLLVIFHPTLSSSRLGQRREGEVTGRIKRAKAIGLKLRVDKRSRRWKEGHSVWVLELCLQRSIWEIYSKMEDWVLIPERMRLTLTESKSELWDIPRYMGDVRIPSFDECCARTIRLPKQRLEAYRMRSATLDWDSLYPGEEFSWIQIDSHRVVYYLLLAKDRCIATRLELDVINVTRNDSQKKDTVTTYVVTSITSSMR